MGEAKRRREAFENAHKATAAGLIDAGMLVSGGFAIYRETMLPKDISDADLRTHYITWVASAQHLFGSVFNTLDDGEEITEKDMQRMQNVQDEIGHLSAFLHNLAMPVKGNG